MSKELENEVPLSSKEAGMKLHYLYYQQFHSLHRMYRTNATRAEQYFHIMLHTFIVFTGLTGLNPYYGSCSRHP